MVRSRTCVFFVQSVSASVHLPAIMTDRKAVVKNADMSEDMQQEAVDVATQVHSLENQSVVTHAHAERGRWFMRLCS